MWRRYASAAGAGPGRAARIAALIGAGLLCHGCGSSGGVRTDAAGGAEGTGEAAVEPQARAAYEGALAAMVSGDTAEAELELERFVLEYPRFPGAYVNLAIVYERDDRLEEAREALDGALAIDPGHAKANNQLGILLRRQGAFAEAEKAYLRAIETDPDYALAHRNLGVLLDLYLHRPAEALRHYRRFQELSAEPDAAVERWIIDLERRVRTAGDAARLAQEDGA